MLNREVWPHWVLFSVQPSIHWLFFWGNECTHLLYTMFCSTTTFNEMSWETLGWMKHKLESRLLGEISITSICRWHHPNGRKWRRTKEPLDESERGEWKSWLKAQHSENKDQRIYMKFRKMVTITPCTRQQKRHWCIEQSYALCWRGRGWEDLGEWHWNMYNIMYETSCQSRFNALYWMLGAGALGRPRGMVWGGRREEGSGWGAYVYLWQIRFDVWQN